MTLEGATFNGYLLLQLLGRGGAGEVYLAESPATGPVAGEVAIKIYPDARGNPDTRELLFQIRSVAALQHPQILLCYAEAAQGNDIGIVMEFAPGGSLGDTLASSNSNITLPLHADTVSRIITQVAGTLADVHAQGLAHGDLKPTNLFLLADANGNSMVSISDFGQSFVTDFAAAAVGQRGAVPPEWAVEQLTWAAPEQLQGTLLPESDQYSLAALAYFLLTGFRPVSAEAQIFLGGRAPQPIIPPSQLNPALSHTVDTVLLHALAPLPEQRYDDVISFADALDEVLAKSDTHTDDNSASRLIRAPRGDSGGYVADVPPKRTLTQMRFAAVSPRQAEYEFAPEEYDDASYQTDAPAKPRRRFTLVAVAMLLICALGALVFTTGVGNIQARLGLSQNNGPSSTPTAQSSPTPANSVEAQTESRLRDALIGRPTFSDALTGTPATWPLNGKSVSFGADHRLHLINTAKTPLFSIAPQSATIPAGAYIATVDVALVKGSPSDHAGMCFLVSTADKGDTYYSYLVASDGRFELWLQQPATGLVFLTSGYVPSLQAGQGKSNTLAILVDPATNTLTLFANGTFVYQAPISHGVAMTGRLGLLTPDNGVDAAFANFAIYKA